MAILVQTRWPQIHKPGKQRKERSCWHVQRVDEVASAATAVCIEQASGCEGIRAQHACSHGCVLTLSLQGDTPFESSQVKCIPRTYIRQIDVFKVTKRGRHVLHVYVGGGCGHFRHCKHSLSVPEYCYTHTISNPPLFTLRSVDLFPAPHPSVYILPHTLCTCVCLRVS